MTHYGRHTAGRSSVASSWCQSCTVRLTIGDPRPSASWPARLRLDPDQWDALLSGAAEYRDLCIEAGEPEAAVPFADWIAGVARQTGVHVEADGAPARSESGGFARARNYTHRRPDPLPRVSLPRTIRGVA